MLNAQSSALILKYVLQSVTARENFLRELKVFMRLVLGCHPSTNPLIQQNVLGVERFKLWVFRCTDFL
jgi:hypothetical protein